jgi:hypothetical protein
MQTFKDFINEGPKFKKGDNINFHDDLKRMQQGTVKSIQNIKGTTVYKIDRHGVKFSRKEDDIYESKLCSFVITEQEDDDDDRDDVQDFRRKPNKIQAHQWDGDEDSIPEEIWDHKMFTIKGKVPTIKTLEGSMTVSLKDWIVIGVAGELFPVKPDIFKKNYSKA